MRTRVLLATTIVGLLLLTGCGSGGPTTSTEAKPEPAATTSPSTPSAPPARKPAEVAETDWPFFGRTPQRTQYLAEPLKDLRPPLTVAWT
jgi:hypothetical protein